MSLKDFYYISQEKGRAMQDHMETPDSGQEAELGAREKLRPESLLGLQER